MLSLRKLIIARGSRERQNKLQWTFFSSRVRYDIFIEASTHYTSRDSAFRVITRGYRSHDLASSIISICFFFHLVSSIYSLNIASRSDMVPILSMLIDYELIDLPFLSRSRYSCCDTESNGQFN